MRKKNIYFLVLAGLLSADSAAGQITIPNPLKHNDLRSLLINGIIPAVSGVVASLSVIMIIIAGIMYLLSAGSPDKITTAKKALVYAIIGLVVALASWAIAQTIFWVLGVN